MQLTDIVHQRLAAQLKPGDCAVDATAGNGHDTLKMAQLVGASGQVLAVDIQEAAIEATRARLLDAGWVDQVRLVVGDHAFALEASRSEFGGRAAAVVFNLGYLPGSDKQLQTMPTSTKAALDAAMGLLKPRGLLLVTAYRGHPGGQEEADAVKIWMQAQEKIGSQIEAFAPTVKGPATPPILWLLRVGEV